MESILERIQPSLASANGAPHALQLLPKCLNLLATVEKCSVALGDASTARDGGAIVGYALRAVQATAWPSTGVLGLALVLRELEVHIYLNICLHRFIQSLFTYIYMCLYI